MRRLTLLIAACCLHASLSKAQPAAPPPPHMGNVVVTGSLRTRVEGWNWFDRDPNGEYVFSGSLARVALRETRKPLDWTFEVAAPFLLGLPDDAMTPGASGQLGLGAAYYAANDNHRNVGHAFVKQAFVRFKNLGGRAGHSLTAGRLEFNDGTELTPPNATLAALKRDRVAQRMVGTFGFSHVGRSFDGVLYSGGASRVNATVLAARPTRGVFQVNGWRQAPVTIVYGAVTGERPHATHPAEWRGFALAYHDGRDGAVKTDNRPITIRRADTEAIDVITFGGHYLGAFTTKSRGSLDALAWAAVQTGSWGSLSHRAIGLALEGGWQPTKARWRPWLRGGWDFGSGDTDPSDGTHGTFFQVLPTPRVYARFPFFNMMNSSDLFAELLLRPTARLATRFDVHALRLASSGDLWYQGGGAFQPNTFGFAGRPGGAKSLATMADAGAEYAASPHAAVGAYYAVARGGSVIKSTYPGAARGSLGYVELTLRF